MSKPEEGYVFLAAIETALREQDWIPAECGERGHWVNPGVAIAEDDRCGWSTEEAVGIQVEHEREQIERYNRYEDDEPEPPTTASKETPIEKAGTTERYTIIDGTRYDLPEDYSLIATDQIDGGVLAGWFKDHPTGCLSVLPQTTDCFEGDQLDGIVADGDDMVWQATLEVEDGRRSEGFGAWPHGRDAALVRAWVEFPDEQPTKDPA